MSNNKSIKYQVQGILREKLAIGESRHKAKADKNDSDKIFSWSTYNNYVKVCTEFGKWAKNKYGEKSIVNSRKYVPDYLNYRISKNLSAWTVALDASALAKLYNCKSNDFGVDLPERKRADIKRSRSGVKGFDEKKHEVIVGFCKATGVRISELRMLKKSDMILKEEHWYVHIAQGKGGKERIAPTLEEYKPLIDKLVEPLKPDEKLFKPKEIPDRLPCHQYRAYYAKTQYNRLARDVNEISRNNRYVCRNDKKGTVYDKKAMLEVSRMLGHNRIDVIASHYLY